MRRTAVLAAAAAALPLVAVPADAASTPQVLASRLSVPWGIAFLPDGSALVTERDSRRVLAVKPGTATRHIYTVREAVPQGEGGLLGIAVGPTYARDGRVYLYYTTATDNRVAYVVRGSAARPKVIRSGIPRAGNHNGGRIAFGPDGHLYVGTGDAGSPQLAQDVSSLAGKVLRMTRDGGVPSGNPRAGSVVWSHGHRNVQGLDFDAQGRLWASELGQNSFDEVNLISPGVNYGWPVVEGRGGRAGYRDPVWTWSTDEASPSGLAVKGGSLWVAALRGRRLWQVRLNGTAATGETAWYTGTYGRLRAAARNPRDGALWLMTSNRDGRGSPAAADDRIVRITRIP